MEFQAPEFLWLLILVPLLILAYIVAQRRRSQFALRYSNLSLVKEALDKGPGIRRHLPPAFFLLGITLMFIAMGRPTGIVLLPRAEATVILAIDVSRSMSARDLEPNRLEAAKAAARIFVEQQDPNTRIGIVSFSGNAALVQAPTTKRPEVLAAINRLSIQNSTAIGSAIRTSLDAIFEDPLAKVVAPKDEVLSAPTPTPMPVPRGVHIPSTVVLLTDGRNRTGPDPIESARTAADRGVRVFTIGVGTAQGATIQPQQGSGNPRGGQGFGNPGFGNQGPGGGGPGGFRADLDETTLKDIARITDAEYHHASDSDGLVEIYRNLEKEVIMTEEKQEGTVFFTASGFVMLLIGGVLSMMWFSRLP